MDSTPHTSPAGISAMLAPALQRVGVGELVAFVALDEHGGFTRAACALHLSQPGMSARIHRLERALGCRLVDRSVRRLTLTPAGAAFLPEARGLLVDLMRSHLRLATPPADAVDTVDGRSR